VTERGRPPGRPPSEALAERLRDSAIGMLDLFAVYAGDRLGWYTALEAGASTAAELAAATGTHERYARAAGFGDVTILPIEHDEFRFYRLD
jgi:hypothetical protein